MSTISFSDLKLSQSLTQNITSLGYESMTPIQAESLPSILCDKDVIGQAKTGSGKTAAFAIGILAKLDPKKFYIQALVLCPTRELADQVAQEVRKLGRAIPNVKVLTLFGGTPFISQRISLEHGAHIIIGTPGRIEDHLNRGTLNLKKINMLVLDEADRMLDMGFQTQLDAIIEHLPKSRQTLLFSATFSPKIKSISQRVMNNPIMIKTSTGHDKTNIVQHFYQINNNERLDALHKLLMHFNPNSSIVFCNTKKVSEDIKNTLTANGFNALMLNADLEQRDREDAIVKFANKSVNILVATDIAARGLNIEAVDVVFNYDIAHDPEVHLHRIGRTGRAGATGIACSLYSEHEAHKLALLDLDIDPIINSENLPSSNASNNPKAQATMATILIHAGKKNKLRPGDILGALTNTKSIEGKHVGKIQIFSNKSYVAVNIKVVNIALSTLNQEKIKGRSFKARKI